MGVPARCCTQAAATIAPMCGRYSHRFKWQQLQRLMRLLSWPSEELPLRYNVPPSAVAPLVRLNERGERVGTMLRWGFVPAGVDDPDSSQVQSLARGETVRTSPMFRESFAQRRCIVPVSGVYEWQRGVTPKQPFWLGRRDREPFGLAGIWNRWAWGQRVIEAFAIITVGPNRMMEKVHDRMPVILAPDDYALWLDTGPAGVEEARQLLSPMDDAAFEVHPVSPRVNSTANDDAGLEQPFTPPQQGLFG